MLDLEACALAGELLRTAGFEHRHTSMKSEAVYYGWPGRHQVIRVACHKPRQKEQHGIPVLVTVTINSKNFRTDPVTGKGAIPRSYVIREVTRAIGTYMLAASGAMRARARYRMHWPDGEQENKILATLEC